MEALSPFLCRTLPPELEPLMELALDVRWTWNHGSDRLWEAIDPETWEATRNPWWILQSASHNKLEQLRNDTDFQDNLRTMITARKDYLHNPGWFGLHYPKDTLRCVAYFSMEFGLGEAIPLYAGGLGMLAGDLLKTAGDMKVPMVGVGLLYQEGYFRQILADDGTQTTANPHNDPTNMPIRPVVDKTGGWLRVPLELPGRNLLLRVWQLNVGSVVLYLLDSNDPLNEPADRSLIYKLYDNRPEFRIVQEMALGIAGWRVLESLGIEADVCHLNEGHAAFAVLERARSLMNREKIPFGTALWATRAGNVFTTHTAVPAAFDVFPSSIISRYLGRYAGLLDIPMTELLELGQANVPNTGDSFNMAVLATRGCTSVNGVSRLHGEVSRRIFQPLYYRWPEREVPVSHVTNGVHMPSWDSQWADEIWMNTAGKGCWCQDLDVLEKAVGSMTDERLWDVRNLSRHRLVDYVRGKLTSQFKHYSSDRETLRMMAQVLDPDVLTMGLARRFAEYKRPNLLLHDPERLVRILTDKERPVQLVVAGKAHPQDDAGRELIRRMVVFARRPDVRKHVVFLPDYDIGLAAEMVHGVDLWINTPRRPWEACGTSGMKVLVNGGLNLSELDGWWAEAYRPEAGWAIGNGREHDEADWDAVEAEQLYQLLERHIVPEYYERDERNIPVRWVSRIRNSMRQLAPQFSSNRMMREYVEEVYLPAVLRLKDRSKNKCKIARELWHWNEDLAKYWNRIHMKNVRAVQEDSGILFTAEVYSGALNPGAMNVEVIADPLDGWEGVRQPLTAAKSHTGEEGWYRYEGTVATRRPLNHFSLRVVPHHPKAMIPLECPLILWKDHPATF